MTPAGACVGGGGGGAGVEVVDGDGFGVCVGRGVLVRVGVLVLGRVDGEVDVEVGDGRRVGDEPVGVGVRVDVAVVVVGGRVGSERLARWSSLWVPAAADGRS